MHRFSTFQARWFGLLLVLCGSSVADEPSSIDWHADIREAWEKMLAVDQPMLLFITMDHCAHCAKMKRTTYTDDRIVALVQRSYVPTVINGTQWKELTRRLGVRVFPTTAVISPENHVIDHIPGFVDAQRLHQRLALVSDRSDPRR